MLSDDDDKSDAENPTESVTRVCTQSASRRLPGSNSNTPQLQSETANIVPGIYPMPMPLTDVTWQNAVMPHTMPFLPRMPTQQQNHWFQQPLRSKANHLRFQILIYRVTTCQLRTLIN